MEIIKRTGVKIGKMIISIISSQIVKYTSSEEFKKRVSEMLDETVGMIVKAVMKELKTK
ncbi:hypothetical protein [Vagococcus luciliae]|uniref:Uncharacterized protein n=1 Tax=Vagococcus luciliae TaxID=2920380 RepID=A0ABY5P077_9ENTE|nr:hypothetical protein [Vagococcus luciliae]UUV99331.1 hypothetical protein G314FT_14920 [Vagococcus luciliae]